MNGIEIVNASGMNSYMITRQVESSLVWIPKADLEGLKVIRCIDQIDLQDQTARNAQQKVNPHGYDITGMYYRERGEFPATIELHVGTIYRDIPRFLMYSSIPVLRLTETLAHEVGHHIAARGVASSFLNFRFSHKTDEEEFAEEYARRLQGRMLNKLRFRVARFCLRRIASILVNVGIYSLAKRNYTRAVHFFYRAWMVDNSYDEASRWYWYAKKVSGDLDLSRLP